MLPTQEIIMLKFQIEIFTGKITYSIGATMTLAKNFD
jgi:hypothetical protein